jgi:ABC-type amino acid transport substrate-binding protein
MVLLTVAGLAWLGLGRRDTTLAQIQESGVWRVGMDPSFPPFENLDPATGLPAGFDVDLTRAIAAYWGVRAEIVSVAFDQLIDALTAQRIDSAISALPVFDERTQEVAFSAPYFDAGLVLAVPPGSPIAGTPDLAGGSLAVDWGSEADAEARALRNQLDGRLELVVKETAADALTAVVTGQAAAALVDAVSLALFRQSGGELVATGPPLRSDPYVIVVRAQSSELLEATNEALAALESNGTLDRLRERWLGPAP